jgi:hypothetical protein
MQKRLSHGNKRSDFDTPMEPCLDGRVKLPEQYPGRTVTIASTKQNLWATVKPGSSGRASRICALTIMIMATLVVVADSW